MTRVAFVTTFAELFGDHCHSWRDGLERAGHRAAVLALPNDWPHSLPVEGTNINVLVAGLHMLRLLGKHGLPRSGKNVLWVFEPLTDDPGSEKHHHKTTALAEVGARFDGFLAMDDRIASYLHHHYPDVPCACVPLTFSPEAITEPLPDQERSTDVLWLARMQRSARRQAVLDWFREVGFPVHHVNEGLYGGERDRAIAEARLSLEVHGDHLFYCNQLRLFLAWAHGSVVVCEPCDHYARFGIEDGVHLLTAEWRDFPLACAELLALPETRTRMARAAQELLRARYTTDRWVPAVVEFLRGL